MAVAATARELACFIWGLVGSDDQPHGAEDCMTLEKRAEDESGKGLAQEFKRPLDAFGVLAEPG